MMLCKTSRVAAALIAAMLSVVMLLTGSQAALAEPFHPRAAHEHSRGYRTFHHGHERIFFRHGHERI
ncbi:MAG TPA: hypothetical protein VJ955_03160, partial [Desulfuromonadales bacterium]|nr:hypothetical protein [Desulfuromonadales bacterium]